jgi:NADPH:quinone reductase-like Zn-dependent oxidoreductase
MKAYQLQEYGSLDALKLIELPEPKVGKNEVLVKIKANSLNYRELIILRGGYDRNKKIPVIPASDGVGEVVDIGENVTDFKLGDRVAGTFFQDWQAGVASVKVIITSSSDEKLDRAISLGADATVNYRTHSEWQEKVRYLTDGVGVDAVVEVGGEETFDRSISSTRLGGYIGVIGALSGFGAANFTPAKVFFNRLRIQGIYVGNKQMFEEMNAAISLHRLRPVVDRVIPFAETKQAYQLLESGKHFGKIVISHA